MAILEPSFTYDNHLGTLKVYKEAFPKADQGQPSWFKQVRDCFEWKRNSVHGNHDRLIWDGRKVKQIERADILERIREKLLQKLGWKTMGSESFANYYKGSSNRTFWHRDYDCNPGESVSMVTFGATRTLTFVDYRSDKAYPVDLGDRDIVVFDFNWNFNTFHAVEQVAEVSGERISLQFFNVRDGKKWTQKQLKDWGETASLVKQGVSRRRDKMKELLACKNSPSVSGVKRKHGT